MEGEIPSIQKDRLVLSKDKVEIHISKVEGSHIPSAAFQCSLAEKLSKVGFYHIHGAGLAAIGFQMSYERQEPVRLRSPFRHCWVPQL